MRLCVFDRLRKARAINDERGKIMGLKGRLPALFAALLLLIFALSLPALADDGVVSGNTVSGTVRVYLSSLRSLTSVDLTVAGSYSIGGDSAKAIARGTKLTVSNSGGTLRLSMNGQTQTMGSRFKLRRHQTSGENGVRIAQARYPGSLYPGDVEFIANGGNVQIVVHVYMEDYMLGVLPYEMLTPSRSRRSRRRPSPRAPTRSRR